MVYCQCKHPFDTIGGDLDLKRFTKANKAYLERVRSLRAENYTWEQIAKKLKLRSGSTAFRKFETLELRELRTKQQNEVPA